MRKILGIFLVCGSVLFTQAARASIWPDYTPLLPFAPQICFQCTPEAISTLLTTAEQVNEMKQKLEGANLIKQATQMLQNYTIDLGKSSFQKLLKKKLQKKKVVTASRLIEDSSLTVAADIKDMELVKEAFITLFLQYPSKNSTDKRNYLEHGRQLTMDTTLEMYITAREMNKELRTMLAELDNIEKCLVAGEDCSEQGMEQYNCQQDGAEDKVCIWRNALTAGRIYDKIMRYNEFLSAMNAQYNAVRGINSLAKVREFEEDNESKNSSGGEKQSYLQDIRQAPAYRVASASSVIVVMNASADTKMESKYDTLDDAGVPSPLEGKEKEYSSMVTISAAKTALNNALRAHNFKQSLPQYRHVFETYNNFKAYYEQARDNLEKSEDCVNSYVHNYYTDNAAWFGMDCVRFNHKYQCHYLPEKEFEDKTDSIGEYDVACEDDASKKCYVISYNDLSEKVSGIWGWLKALSDTALQKLADKETDAYENGEDADTEDIQKDTIYMSQNTDLSQNGLLDKDKIKATADKSYKSDNKGTNAKIYKTPSMEEDMYAQARIDALANWELGKQTSQMLNSEFVSGSTNFGTKSGRISLWNDQRFFYREYLSDKYKNMMSYVELEAFVSELHSASMAINAAYPYTDIKDAAGRVVKSAAKQRAEAAAKIQGLSGVGTPPSRAQLETIVAASKTALQGLIDGYKSQVEVLKSQKPAIYAQMDKISQKYSEVQDKLNKANSDISDADSEMQDSKDALVKGQDLERSEKVYPQSIGFNDNIDENSEQKDKAATEADSLELSAEKLQKQLDKYRAELEDIDQKIYQAKADFVLAYNDAKDSYKQSIDDAAGAYIASKQEFLQKVATVVALTPEMGIAQTLLDNAKKQAIEEIARVGLNIENSGDIIFTEAGWTDSVRNPHNELLDWLSNMPLVPPVILVKGIDFGGYISSYQQMLSAVAAGGKSEVGDSENYVGRNFARNGSSVIAPAARDFMTPKSAIDFSSAPLREVFHFDTDDYDAVLKYMKGGVDSNPESNEEITLVGPSLTLSGLELPKIWYTILSYLPYSETELDFDKLFHSYGDNVGTLAGSGIYPCKDGGKAITATEDGYAYTSPNTIDVCTTIVDGKDKEAGVSISISNNSTVDTKNWKQTSELGQIMDYVVGIKITGPLKIEKAGHLTFNRGLQKAIYNIKKSDKIDEDDNQSRNYFRYSRFLMEHNQFGDYLDNVVVLKKAEDALNLQQQQVDGLRKQLQDMFGQLEPKQEISSDFDLSNGGTDCKEPKNQDGDYCKAMNALKSVKNGAVRNLGDLIAQIDGKTNLIITNKEKLVHAKEVLEKDSEEQAQITGEEDLTDLEEKIKNSAADQAVTDTYESESNKSFNKQMESLRPPYCAVYPY